MRRLLVSLGFLALALGIPAVAIARSEKTRAYSRDQAWPTAVRFLVVDERLKILEKDGEVGYVLIEQRGDRREPPRGVSRPHAGASWPSASVQILGEQLIALIGDQPALTLDLLPTPTPLQ